MFQGPTRHMIEDGTLPMFYVNKLQFQGYSRPSITLGMLMFLSTIVNHLCMLKKEKILVIAAQKNG